MKLNPSPKLVASAKLASRTSDRLADALAAGVVPWARSAHAGVFTRLPVDGAGVPFTGVSRWLLEIAAYERGYLGSRWSHDPTGEPGVETVVGKVVEGQAWKDYTAVTVYPVNPFVSCPVEPDYEAAQKIVDAAGARVRRGLDCRYIRIRENYREFDYITLPPVKQFVYGEGARYWSLFHELIHWACLGSNRLGWEGDYSQGEMIADMGATVLAARFGIPVPPNLLRGSPHRKRWLEEIRHDSDYFYHSADTADLAVSFLLRGETDVDQGDVQAGTDLPAILPVCHHGQPQAVPATPLLDR